MKTVVVTGATGFLGSALTASLLARGHRVIALSRNDPEGLRTSSAVLEAARGFGIEQSLGLTRLKVVEGVLSSELMKSVDEVWNCAADMSYSMSKLPQAMQQNVETVDALYRLTLAHAPNCWRFFHVSTAYTSGMEGGEVGEVLHAKPTLINSYQISKWSAEERLARLSRDSLLPITLVRPSIVIGHRKTGWSSGKKFGYFMFVSSILHLATQGVQEIKINLSSEQRPNLIPISDLIEGFLALSDRQERKEIVPSFEILNCTQCHSLTIGQHLEIVSKIFDVRVTCGAPITEVDHQLNAAIQLNREFAAQTWRFKNDEMRKQAGIHFGSEPVDDALMIRVINEFVAHLERIKLKQENPPVIRLQGC